MVALLSSSLVWVLHLLHMITGKRTDATHSMKLSLAVATGLTGLGAAAALRPRDRLLGGRLGRAVCVLPLRLVQPRQHARVGVEHSERAVPQLLVQVCSRLPQVQHAAGNSLPNGQPQQSDETTQDRGLASAKQLVTDWLQKTQ